MELKQDEWFLKKAYERALIPCILSVLSGNLNILADGILVGQRLGTDALVAINFSLPVYLLLCIAGSFIVSGTAICASDAIGKDRPEKAQDLYKMAFFWCAAVSVILTAAGLLFLPPLFGFLCPDGAVAAFAAEYAAVTIAGALPKILIYVPFWFLRLDGRNGQVTVMMLVMGVGNVILDVVFLYALDLGARGGPGQCALHGCCGRAGFCAVVRWEERFSFWNLGLSERHLLLGGGKGGQSLRREQSVPDTAGVCGERAAPCIRRQ